MSVGFGYFDLDGVFYELPDFARDLDQKMVDIGLIPSLEVGKAEYDGYIRNGMLTQLQRLELGKQVEEETSSKLQLKASNGNDYVDVEYKKDAEDLETTQKFHVETSFDGVITEKDIKVTMEDGSLKVTIEDLYAKYNLKKNTEDDEGTYKLDYTIDGEKSRASIYEDVDVDGNPVYRYEIREANLTETIIVARVTNDSDEQDNSFNEESKQINWT